MKKVMLIAALFILFAGMAEAQTVLSVPIATGQLSWHYEPADATHSDPSQTVIVCGPKQTVIAMPTTSIAVSQVVPGPGSYTCVAYGQNDFSKSEEAAFPPFVAGFSPMAPAGMRIEVR